MWSGRASCFIDLWWLWWILHNKSETLVWLIYISLLWVQFNLKQRNFASLIACTPNTPLCSSPISWKLSLCSMITDSIPRTIRYLIMPVNWSLLTSLLQSSQTDKERALFSLKGEEGQKYVVFAVLTDIHTYLQATLYIIQPIPQPHARWAKVSIDCKSIYFSFFV